MHYIIETLEPERDRLYKRNEHLKNQVDLFQEIIDNHKREFEENQTKINQIEYFLDKHIYNHKEEP